MKIRFIAAIALGAMVISPVCNASGLWSMARAAEAVRAEFGPGSVEVASKGRLEVAFSPDEGAEKLVIKVIDSASRELLVLSYSFTSAPVTEALIRAVHRGVTVRLVADAKNNTSDDRSGKARAALNALKNAGADVRLISAYQIHHDKTIIADRQTVQLGSFNYSAAAAHQNSENVLVNWNNPDLANTYLQHFDRNYRKSEPLAGRY